MDSRLGLVGNLAWAAALGKLLVVVPDSPQAADQEVVWADPAQGRLGILDKVAFLMVDFLQVEDTSRKRVAVLMEVVQSHLEGLVENPQVLEDTCLVVHLSLQKSLPYWMPAMTVNKARDKRHTNT